MLWVGAYLSLNLYGILWFGVHLSVNLRRILGLGSYTGFSGLSLGAQADFHKMSSRIFEISHNQQFQINFKENLIL